jgi:hypothetical protein
MRQRAPSDRADVARSQAQGDGDDGTAAARMAASIDPRTNAVSTRMVGVSGEERGYADIVGADGWVSDRAL